MRLVDFTFGEEFQSVFQLYNRKLFQRQLSDFEQFQLIVHVRFDLFFAS
jgi:hypothetical protein